MELADFEQGSPDWLRWRLEHLGGSDANLIAAFFLDVDYPYGSWAGAELYKLWSLKTGRTPIKDGAGDYEGDPKVHGRKTEPVAREWYSMETGELCAPVCGVHSEIPYLAASLDGWTGEFGVEIKCPTEPQQHRLVKEGRVPEQYYAQVQHNLFVTGAAKLDFVSFYKGEGIILPVTADDTFLPQLRRAEDAFWQWVETKKFGAIPQGEYTIPETEGAHKQFENWGELVAMYLDNVTRQRDLEASERAIKLKMLRMMMNIGGKVKGFGATVSVRVQGPATVPAFDKSEFLKFEVRRS